jgi:hypothetical protein
MLRNGMGPIQLSLIAGASPEVIASCYAHLTKDDAHSVPLRVLTTSAGEQASAVLAASRDPSRWLGDASVTFRAGELTLQTGEGVNDFRRLECSVASTHRDLIEDACFREPVDRLIRLHLAPVNQLGGAVDGDNRCTN